MGTKRDGARTRQRILDAAAAEFAERGFDAVTLAGIARRCALSKQLIDYHFGNDKEELFQQVLYLKFRPQIEDQDAVVYDPVDLFAARYQTHFKNKDYVRFQTWEAARNPAQRLPGHEVRQRRIAEHVEAIAEKQSAGELPSELNPRLLQLAAFALSTYPMAFDQITRMVTGHSSGDAEFQLEWTAFLRELGVRLLQVDKKKKPPRGSRAAGQA